MPKRKNHTAHNQTHKQHRNGIHKPKHTVRAPRRAASERKNHREKIIFFFFSHDFLSRVQPFISYKGVNAKFLKNLRFAKAADPSHPLNKNLPAHLAAKRDAVKKSREAKKAAAIKSFLAKKEKASASKKPAAAAAAKPAAKAAAKPAAAAAPKKAEGKK